MSNPNQTWEIDVYYDYLCPFAYQGNAWLRDVREQLGPERLRISWRFFPLEQVNSKAGSNWKLWEQSDDYPSKGMEAFRATLAAQQQGDELHDRFHGLLFRARHGDFRIDRRRPSVADVAREAGLDVERFEADRADRALLSRIGEDYEYGRNAVGVFGTPTIVFSTGEAAYLKTRPKPPTEEALTVWDEFVSTVVDRPYISEIKRPVPGA